MKECIVGVDVGTTKTKVVVFDKEGCIVGRGEEELKTRFLKPGFIEQDLNEIWYNTASAINKALVNAKVTSDSIKAIAVTGQRETICPIDKDAQPLRRAILWQDTRGWDICKFLHEELGANKVYQITGLPINTMPSVSKIAWIKGNEPEIYNKTWKFVGVVDFTVWKLTGKLMMDYSNASRTMLFDINTLNWSRDIFNALGLDPSKMPELVPPGTKAGLVHRKASNETGLKEGTFVTYAGGDQQCSALGIGVVKPGIVSCILGTCTNIEAFSKELLLDNKMRLQAQVHVIPKSYLLEGGIGTSGVIYRWFRDNFCVSESEVAKQLNLDTYQILDQEAALVPPGAEGLFLIPYFAGSLFPYWNAQDRGILVGLTLAHKGKHLARAILEGVALEYRRMVYDVERVAKIKVNSVRFMGGGARSTLWPQIFVDVLNARGEIPKISETGTLGAYILAATDLGWYENLMHACESVIKIERVLQPKVETHIQYEKIYSIYNIFYQRIRDLINKLSEFHLEEKRE